MSHLLADLKMISFQGIRNFVFDFGEVLYDVDNSLIMKSFLEYIPMESRAEVDLTAAAESAQLFESGCIGEQDFRSLITRMLGVSITDTEFDAAWNSALLGKRKESENLISFFKEFGKVCLLSNTNPIHYRHFAPECSELFGLFDKLYFSHLLKMRKPNLDIFMYMLNDNGFVPSETLFIDDLQENLKHASILGIRTYRAAGAEDLEQLKLSFSRSELAASRKKF